MKGSGNPVVGIEPVATAICIIDSSVNKEFEKKLRHRNYIFSNGIDFIHEFFNFERKFHSRVLTKSIKLIGKNPSLNKMFTTIADRGINF